jgi:23S rRNA (guanine2445-N2)-methyltransferase / 23S rRNA (guanine2069-N7)-methyltransferase
VKDAIVDQLRDATGARPDVDIRSPDIRINVFLDRDRASVAIDLSGQSLHRRGYRQTQGPAPLKENLAAALLLRAGWPQIARDGGALLDPMCGSGTFAIEALLMAADIAPNLGRFCIRFRTLETTRSVGVGTSARRSVRARERGLAAAPLIRASDHDERAVEAALRNCEAACLSPYVTVEQRELRDIEPPAPRGLLICNPPYGERLSDVDALPALFAELGAVLRARFEGWRASILAPDVELGFRTGLRLKKKNPARNGAIDVVLLTFDVAADRVLPPRRQVNRRAGTTVTMCTRSTPASAISATGSARIASTSTVGRNATMWRAIASTTPICRTTRSRWICIAAARQRGCTCRSTRRPPASMRPRRNCDVNRWKRCCRNCSASTPRPSS